MNRFLAGVDRASLIKGTAVYLIVYAVINACGGLVFGLLGGLSSAAGVEGVTTTGISESAEIAEVLTTLGGFTIVLAALFFISVPVFALTAWGLWQRKAWARIGAVIALGFTLVLSLVTPNAGIERILWIVISAVGIYLYWTDEGIKQELAE